MKKDIKQYTDLTQHQIHALTKTYNLADAHTHQSQSKSQRNIVARLPSLWYEAEQQTQAALEQRFIEKFFTFHKQPTALETPTMLVYAASIAMVMAANYMKKKNWSVSLITPCFDNLYDILRHMEVPLSPLHEAWLHDPETIYDTLKKEVTSDVLFLVSPNNPTGFELTVKDKKGYAKRFEELIRFCKDFDKTLAIDFCFASFLLGDEDMPTFDVYKLLNDSGVRYISIEDTGKTWPLQDAKVAMLKTSMDIYEEMYDIHTAYLLNVSPFILNVVTAYIEDSITDRCKSIYSLLRRNRAIAEEVMKDSLLELQETEAEVSVAWFKITNPKIKATALQQFILEQQGVYSLPGTYFFWDDKERGEAYLRVALARNSDIFKEAMIRLRRAVDVYETR